MRYWIIIALVCIGCQDVERIEKPDDLIAMDKMADIMADAYLGNAAKSINTWLLKDKGVQLDNLIYTKHGVDSLQFVRSNAYYTSNLDLYNELFTKVEARLVVVKTDKDSLKAQFDREKRLNTMKRDSIRKSRQKKLVDPVISHPHQDTIE